MVTLSLSLRIVFRCPHLTQCTVGNPLISSMGQSQSREIGEVVALVAQLAGIVLSPESPVWYGQHHRKSWSPFDRLSSYFLVWVYPSSLHSYGLIGSHFTAFFLWLTSYCSLQLAFVPWWWSQVGIWHGCFHAGELLLFLGASCCRLCPLENMHWLRSSFRWANGLYSILPHTSNVLV